MSESVKKMFAEIAGRYDLLNHLLSFNIDRSWRNKTIASLEMPLNQHFKALDLCAGTLDLTLALAQKYPSCEIIAADFCYPMLNAGMAKIKPKDKKRIQLCCADALKLPFTDNSFDAIFCGYGFRNLDDPLKAIDELKRILKPGGQLLILDFFKPERKITRLFHQTYGRFILPLIGRLIASNKQAYVYLNRSVDSFMSVSEAVSLVKERGFKEAKKSDFFLGISSLLYARN